MAAHVFRRDVTVCQILGDAPLVTLTGWAVTPAAAGSHFHDAPGAHEDRRLLTVVRHSAVCVTDDDLVRAPVTAAEQAAGRSLGAFDHARHVTVGEDAHIDVDAEAAAMPPRPA